MNDDIKWIILSSEVRGRRALDTLVREYKNIPDTSPELFTPSAQRLIKLLENPPIDGVRYLCYKDADYPEQLKVLNDPPSVLYVLGDSSILGQGVAAAVVGSREATPYGLSVTMDFCRDFCEMGMTVISGGARGVDSAAAETALKFGGKTVAVLGCGLDITYPAENRALFGRIVSSGGALVSEYPFGVTPIPANFPRRNRIIAALADCCVVTEAGLRSGSLITANLAADLRKPIFAVPGNITSHSSTGTNHLIKTGASLATSGLGVAAELKVLLSFSDDREPKSSASKKTKFTPLIKAEPKKVVKAEQPKKTVPKGLSPEEAAVIEAVENGNTSVRSIAQASGLPEVSLAPALIMMELKGLLVKESDGYRLP